MSLEIIIEREKYKYCKKQNSTFLGFLVNFFFSILFQINTGYYIIVVTFPCLSQLEASAMGRKIKGGVEKKIMFHLCFNLQGDPKDCAP